MRVSRGSGSATPASTRSSGARRVRRASRRRRPSACVSSWRRTSTRSRRSSAGTTPTTSGSFACPRTPCRSPRTRARAIRGAKRLASASQSWAPSCAARACGSRRTRGPYTVPASADEAIAAAAVRELDYHAELMGAFGLDRSHKIVLHLGEERATARPGSTASASLRAPRARSSLTSRPRERRALVARGRPPGRGRA